LLASISEGDDKVRRDLIELCIMEMAALIKKFVGSNAVLDMVAKECFERLPLKLRYRIYYGKHFLYWLAFLKESEYWDRDRLESFQFERLKALLRHASQNVLYYKKRFSDYGITPDTLQCIDDIKQFPFLTKQTVRDNANDLIAVNLPKSSLVKTTTAGSTGIPLVIWKTRESVEREHGSLFDVLSRVGYNPKKRIVSFQWGDITGGRKEGNFLKYGNKLVLSAIGTASAETMYNYHKLIASFRPDFIAGFKTILLFFASFIKEQGLLPFTGPKAVLAYAESIYPWQREAIERSLGARVFSTYGLHEDVIFGGECEYSYATHLYPQSGITELFDLDGTYSEMIGTGFSNYAMPFIRYRTMDFCTKGENSCKRCGRNFTLLEEINGRVNEFLVNKDGRLVYPVMEEFNPDIFKNVKEFQFFQDEPGIAYMRIVARSAYSDSDTLAIKNEIVNRLNIPGSGIEIGITVVDHVERTSSYKSLRTDQRLDIKNFIRT
jgi:phenylacetate-CoA ligase